MAQNKHHPKQNYSFVWYTLYHFENKTFLLKTILLNIPWLPRSPYTFSPVVISIVKFYNKLVCSHEKIHATTTHKSRHYKQNCLIPLSLCHFKSKINHVPNNSSEVEYKRQTHIIYFIRANRSVFHKWCDQKPPINNYHRRKYVPTQKKAKKIQSKIRSNGRILCDIKPMIKILNTIYPFQANTVFDLIKCIPIHYTFTTIGKER